MRNVRLPDLSRPKPYEHRKPHRPSHMPRRMRPPPDRKAPPDLSLFLYAGIALAVIVLLVAIPYAIAYIVEVLST
jgi:hypothetical protein